MARAKSTESEEIDPQRLGNEGDTCSQCGTRLATDQRYCLNCGTPRAEPRLDFERALAPPNGATAGQGAGQSQAMQWTPLAAVVAIAILGGMLLLGVLIGQDDNSVTVTEVQQTAGSDTAATTTESTTTESTTTAPETTTTPPTTTTNPDSGSSVAPADPGSGGFGAPAD